MLHYVYAVINKLNGKFYVGKHSTDRLDDGYLGSGTVLKAAKAKYGKENFELKILHVCESCRDAFDLESLIVDDEFLERDDVYNVRRGGCGFSSKDAKLLKFRLDANADYRFRQSVSAKRYWSNENNKIKHGITAANVWKDPQYRERMIPKMCGRDHSGYKEKMSNAHKRSWELSGVERRQKISESNSKHQTGQGNSQYGTFWVCNPEGLVKKIRRDALEEHLQCGWRRGRKYPPATQLVESLVETQGA